MIRKGARKQTKRYDCEHWLLCCGLRVVVSHKTIWRNVQAEDHALQKGKQWKPMWVVVGLYGTYILGWGEKQLLLVAVDLGSGQPLALGYVNEHDL